MRRLLTSTLLGVIACAMILPGCVNDLGAADTSMHEADAPPAPQLGERSADSLAPADEGNGSTTLPTFDLPVDPAPPTDDTLSLTWRAVPSSEGCKAEGDTPSKDGFTCSFGARDDRQSMVLLRLDHEGTECDGSRACRGETLLDVSAAKTLELTVLAPEGQRIRVDGGGVDDRLEIELQLLSDSDCPFEPQALRVRRSEITWHGLEGPEPQPREGFVDIGYEANWEIFARAGFAAGGPLSFEGVTLRFDYDPDKACAGPQPFRWSWDGYAWVELRHTSSSDLRVR